MSLLDNLISIPAITRINYGNDKERKPNNHCYWSDGPYESNPHWAENDEAPKRKN